MLGFIQAAAPQPEVWWQHMLEIIIGGSAPTIFVILKNRSNAKRQAEEQAAKLAEAADKKHKENTDRLNHQDEKLDEILQERKYIPAHGHREASGPLSAENIFPKR